MVMFKLNAWIIKDLEEYQSCCLSGGSSGIAISRAAVVSQDTVVVAVSHLTPRIPTI